MSKRDGLVEPPRRQFFMNVADLAFWLTSARSDAYLATRSGEAAERFELALHVPP